MSCPICEKEANKVYRPFCSRRCSDVDLGKWLGGGYAIASSDPDDEDELIDALEKAADVSDSDPDLTRLS